MSAFPKILWGITVPAGGWVFAFNDGVARTVTVPAGTYDHILDLCTDLQALLIASPSALTFTVTCSSLGTVVISADGAWTVSWAGTANALSSQLGFAETEAVDGANALTATSQHLSGWYPGLMSWGRTVNRGTGFASRFGFKMTWPVSQAIAGNEEARTIGPANPSRESPFELDVITWTEYDDTLRGLAAWWTACVMAPFYVYPNRALGTVASWGTQNVDFYIATLVDGVVRDRDVPPLYVAVSALFHREPV
ncbi:hypothetical protein [Zavarzinia sp.]|uniref:hypothetical protein n=1 Tax=Zavarzinia sp. TaxID=2027920 RepID=UPI003565D1B3